MFIRKVYPLIAIIILFGCEPAVDNSLDNIQTQDENQEENISIYLPQKKKISNDRVSQSNGTQDENAEFFQIRNITLDDFFVDIVAKNASVKDVVFALADELNFIVKSDSNYDRKVTIDTEGDVAIEYLLRVLLDGNPFSIQYKDVSVSSRPQIDTLFVGNVSRKRTLEYNPLTSDSDIDSNLDIAFPFSPNLAISIKTYNSSGSYTYSSVSQLLSQSSIEDTIDYISTVDLSETGLRTLAEIFHQSENPDIKLEVISSLSGSDSFAAKWITLNALKDPDERVVIGALEEVNLWLDPAASTYVNSLQNSSNPEIKQLSQEIIESTAEVSTDSFLNLTQEERAAASKKSNQQLYLEQTNRREIEERIKEIQKRQ